MDVTRVNTRPETLDTVIILKARLYDSHCANEQLRQQLEQTQLELKEVQALLGAAVASGTGRHAEPLRTGSDNQDLSVSESPHCRPRAHMKRSRSPSLEYVDPPVIQNIPTVKLETPENSGLNPNPQIPPTQLEALPPRAEIIDLTELEDISVPMELEPNHSPQHKPVLNVGKTCCDAKSPEDMTNCHGQSSSKRRRLEDTNQRLFEGAFPGVNPEVTTTENTKGLREAQICGQTRPRSSQSVAVPDTHESIFNVNNLMRVGPLAQNSESEYSERGIQVKDVSVAVISSSVVEAGSRQRINVPTAAPSPIQAFSLPAEDVQQYLVDVAPFSIQPEPVPVWVPRAFLRVCYGGSDQAFLQNISAERNPSGSLCRRMVFPTLDLNPAMPSVPGAPGLVFASRHEILQDAPWTVFCRKSTASPVVWLYVGEYENTLKGKMTKEQFSAQSINVQREWARSLLKCKRFDVYVAMRARVALRVAGVLPLPGDSEHLNDQDVSQRDEEEAKLVQEEICAVKRDQGRPVSVEDLVAAFINGEEGIDIIQMKCVGYDHVFAADMRERLKSYSKPRSRRRT